MRVPKLPRKTVWMDEKGRIVIPAYLRKTLGIKINSYVDIEAYPDLADCKALFIKKT